MSGGGGSQSNTNTQVVQIPAFEQQASEQNQALAQSLGAQPYPTYNAPLIQGFSPLQTEGQQVATSAATAYQPDLGAAESATRGGLNASGVDYYSGAAGKMLGQAQGLSAQNPGSVAAYMSPYEQEALQPQITAAQTQLGLQNQQTNAQAAQAGAFGDARQGAQTALNNFYGDQTMAGIEAAGMNSAYQNALTGINNQQTQDVNSANTFGNLAGLQGTEQQAQLAGGQQLGSLAGLNQSMGITGANAIYSAGQQQQTQGQNELNNAYQQYLNQVNWPYQMLSVQESALSNSPYNIATSVTLPQANQATQGFGALGGLAGLLGGLGGSGGTGPNVFGAQA